MVTGGNEGRDGMSLHGAGTGSHNVSPVGITAVVGHGVFHHVRDGLAVASAVMLESYNEFRISRVLKSKSPLVTLGTTLPGLLTSL